MYGPGKGSIRIEECPSHKEVVWNFEYSNFFVYSPEFVIGSQSFRLTSYFRFVGCRTYLYIGFRGQERRGPSVMFPDCIVLWWAGFKRHDGSYYHANESGRFDLRDWSSYWKEYFKYYYVRELLAQQLSSDGSMTVFMRFSMKQASPAGETCIHGDKALSTWGDGKIEKKACNFHTEVQWTVHYELSQGQFFYFVSPEFEVGNQRYRLELTWTRYSYIELNLYRSGPSVEDSEGSTEWWAGLKLADGSYYHKNENGSLDLRAECEFSKRVGTLIYIIMSQVEMLHLGKDENLTVVLFLSGNAKAATEICVHSTTNMLGRSDGVIREEERPSHKDIEWNVDFGLASDGVQNLASPVFTFGDQHYRLELSSIKDVCLSLCLLRMGTPVSGAEGSILLCAGLRRADGTYYSRIESRKLELKQNCEIWTEVERLKTVSLSELDDKHLEVDGCVTFFLRLSWEKLLTSSNECKHDADEVCSRSDVSFREVVYPAHKQVEWDIDYEPKSRDCSLTSPLFVLFGQHYMFELRCCGDVWEFHLHKSPCVESIDGSFFRYWVGLKCADGTYNHRIESGKLDLSEECETWSNVACLKRILRGEIEREHLMQNGRFTFFFRTNSRLCCYLPESISHGVAVVPSLSEGTIKREECFTHRHVEWNWNVSHPQEHRNVTSPEFATRNQSFMLELSFDIETVSLFLYRKGPSSLPDLKKGRCWAGLMQSDESYYHRNLTGKVILRRELKTWTKVKTLFSYTADEVERRLLTSAGTLNTFFRLTFTGYLHSVRDTFGMMCGPRTGSLVMVKTWSSYKQLVWDIDCAPAGHITSPSFSIGTQRYIMDFCHKGYVYIFRMGPSVGGLVASRWFIGIEYWNDGYDQYESECGELDLDVACETCTEVKRFYLRKFLPNKTNRLKIFLLMSMEPGQTNAAAEDTGTEVESNVEPTLRENIVFKVQGKEFRTHRAVLRIRVPALETMFHYDTVENRNGVVNIDDCDSDIFEIFLKFVETRELPATTAYDLLAVYAVADKYLMEQLKFMCVCHLTNTLSVDNFSDVVELIMVYGYHDMFEKAASFLCKNKHSIIPSDPWQNFKVQYPEAALKLEVKAVV